MTSNLSPENRHIDKLWIMFDEYNPVYTHIIHEDYPDWPKSRTRAPDWLECVEHEFRDMWADLTERERLLIAIMASRKSESIHTGLDKDF